MTGPVSFVLKGLDETTARERLKADGPNELPRADHRTFLRIVLEVLREPMLALLLCGGVIYLALGDLTEAMIMLGFGTMSIIITVVQESRTERVLEALRDLTSPRALVIREGERRRIPGRDVVRGDIVLLAEGDRVPADGYLIEAQDLLADESLLTGESVSVSKRSAAVAEMETLPTPGGDDLPYVFSGSLIVRGTAICEVMATGHASEIGKIGRSLADLKTETPRLYAETRRLVRIFAAFGILVSATVVLLYGFLRGGWLDAVLAGIAIGMSMLPEEFPVVLTVFMAMGAWRISQVRVLTRRAAAIEALGAATVLCTDKTGTLTENRMSAATLFLESGMMISARERKLTEAQTHFQELVVVGFLASRPDAVDPVERAFQDLKNWMSPGSEVVDTSGWQSIRIYPLRPELPVMAQVWGPAPDSGSLIVAAKGAPEAIARLCHFNADRLASLKRTLDLMAADGLRMLGVARAEIAASSMPEKLEGIPFEFLGVVGLADPLRANVHDAIAKCRKAGIRVVMITGDHPATARAIAIQAGIEAKEILTGDQLIALSDEDLRRRAEIATVYARITPSQKLRIVQALKANGEVVAMTGDGVNDAPSLKAAQIGIAMGGRGTDVAREASSLVLLDDDFSSIVDAVRLGRRIYDNLRKAMSFIFAVHFPIAGLALLPLATGYPIILGPIHIAFLEMVIDPVCSLVFEAETDEGDVMNRPPRNPAERLFAGPLVAWSLIQGVLGFVAVAAIFFLGSAHGLPDTEVRTLVFFSLIMMVVGLILVNRSFDSSLLTAIFRKNRALLAVVIVVPTVLGLALAWPPVTDLFRFGHLNGTGLAFSFGCAFTVVCSLETVKRIWRKRLFG